jgi:hypothetical protein
MKLYLMEVTHNNSLNETYLGYWLVVAKTKKKAMKKLMKTAAIRGLQSQAGVLRVGKVSPRIMLNEFDIECKELCYDVSN